MDSFNPDPNNIGSFELPENLLEQIYDFSGGGDHSKGFLLVFVSQSGAPVIFTKTENQIIELGLRKATEQYLSHSEEVDIDSNIGPQEQ